MSFSRFKLLKSDSGTKLNFIKALAPINYFSQASQALLPHLSNEKGRKMKAMQNMNKTQRSSFMNSTIAFEGSSSQASNSTQRLFEVQKRKNESDTQRHTLLLKRIFLKESQLSQSQHRQRKEQQKEKDEASKRFELRELRRKVSKITDNDSYNICDSFLRLNEAFNSRFLSFLKGRQYFLRSRDYHRNFHHHSNDLSEGHNKFSMLIDIDKLRQGAIPPKLLLKRNLSEAEIKVIRQDPAYFVKKPIYIKNVKGLQKMALLEKLLEEEGKAEVESEDEGRRMKTSRGRDIRFNWTLLECKVDDTLAKVSRKLNKLKTMNGLDKECSRPNLPTKLREEIDNNFRKVMNKHFLSTFSLNFNKRLPRKQLKAYLNNEVSLRLKHEVEGFKSRETVMKEKNNEDYLSQLQLRRIRDNLIKNKRNIMTRSKNTGKGKPH